VIEARRRAYLEAMGFDVWVARSTAADAGEEQPGRIQGHIQVGPGRGSTLLVCAAAADSASRFAADVVRALGGDPAWAWPVRGVGHGAGGDNITLEEAIGARLITRVFVFGGDTARWLFQGEIPPVVGSATVTPLAGVGEIAQQGAAKQALWRCLQDPLRSAPPGGSAHSAA
jgi:hypothetical protein